MSTAKPPGIIDTLSLGFSVLNRHLWLLAIPVVLELFVSFGPKVTAGPVVQQALVLYRESLQSMSPELRNATGVVNVQDMDARVEEAVQPIGSFNLLSLFLWQAPSMAGGSLEYIAGSMAFEVSDFPSLVLTVLFCLALGLLAAAVYLTAVAMPVLSAEVPRPVESAAPSLLSGTAVGLLRSERFGPVGFYRRLQSNWLRLMAYYSLMAVTLAIIGGVVTMVIGAVSLLSQGAGSMLVGIASTIGLMAMMYLFFADEAIVIGGLGPVAAARSSLALVYKNYWSSLGLAVLTTIILAGTHLVWMALSVNAVGAVVGILGNAYISTGITAAIMVFFKDRAVVFQRAAVLG
ncbi:MAG: hypothetical protein EXR50_00335 [Dehalococcoidia bacterium]|nr:hypothetical protein [Dehalococcoidia bacterium]